MMIRSQNRHFVVLEVYSFFLDRSIFFSLLIGTQMLIFHKVTSLAGQVILKELVLDVDNLFLVLRLAFLIDCSFCNILLRQGIGFRHLLDIQIAFDAADMTVLECLLQLPLNGAGVVGPLQRQIPLSLRACLVHYQPSIVRCFNLLLINSQGGLAGCISIKSVISESGMKLLGLIMQNKKGENILMVSAPSLPIRYCAVYSHMIYQHILEIYRNRLKIERTITLEENLFCVVNITKEYILYVFTTKNDLPLAFDGIRKVTEFFNKSGSTAAARLELILKKTVEFMSIFQQFLYTRELPFRDFLPMKHPVTSKKKSVDDEIFNKFAHIGSESDKQIIFSSQIASGKVEALQAKKKIRIIENAQSFQLKSQDDMYLLDIDPEKERYINAYKSSIFKLAMGRKKINRDVYSDDSILVYSESKIGSSIAPKGESNIMVEASSKMKTQNKIEELQQGQKLKLRIKQKLSLELRNEKVKEVHQHGQIFLEGTQVHQAKVILVNETLWKNPKVVSKRITPNSIPCQMISELEYLVKTPQGFKSKPVIDYVLRTETFTPEKIPLLFIYTMEVNSSNIEFTFKYKVNDKWKTKLLDLEITVLLNKQFVVLDCKSIPVAHSLKNNKVVWKTKEIVPGSSNSKGKILLAFGQAKFPPKEILSQVRLSMKSNCGLMQSLGVLCKQQDIDHECTAERTLLIDYKIHP